VTFHVRHIPVVTIFLNFPNGSFMTSSWYSLVEYSDKKPFILVSSGNKDISDRNQAKWPWQLDSITYHTEIMRSSEVQRDLEFTSLHPLFIDFTELAKWWVLIVYLPSLHTCDLKRTKWSSCLVSGSDYISYKTVIFDWFTLRYFASFYSDVIHISCRP
jgi:hypothetical protein